MINKGVCTKKRVRRVNVNRQRVKDGPTGATAKPETTRFVSIKKPPVRYPFILKLVTPKKKFNQKVISFFLTATVTVLTYNSSNNRRVQFCILK